MNNATSVGNLAGQKSKARKISCEINRSVNEAWPRTYEEGIEILWENLPAKVVSGGYPIVIREISDKRFGEPISHLGLDYKMLTFAMILLM